MVETFRCYLLARNLADNTIKAYLHAVELFFSRYENITANHLEDYRQYLISHYKTQTVNLNIIGINSYLAFVDKKELRLPVVKRQQATVLDHIINNVQYEAMKHRMLQDGDIKKYHILWTLATTGVRVSELVRLTVEDIDSGYTDLMSKGRKIRRIYFPNSLRISLLSWCEEEQRFSGPLFINPQGKALSVRSIAKALKMAAKASGVDSRVVHPHAFRHLFAKNFLKHKNDLALLADLLGHESLETTKIYLRYSVQEQIDIINEVVVW